VVGIINVNSIELGALTVGCSDTATGSSVLDGSGNWWVAPIKTAS
jgi:hypothetical protein